MSKIKDIWLVLKAKHYVVLTADTNEEIAWAIESLRKADEVAKREEQENE